MSRIVTNVQSLIAQRVLGGQTKAMNQALTRLSTGLQINTGKDDPAGLIASETLRSDKVAINASIENAERADNLLAVAEGALVEVNRLLLDLEDLVDRSANEAALSSAEISANQAEIDNILQAIDRISNTSQFAGRKVIGGEFDYTTSGTTSVMGSTDVTDIKIFEANIPEGSYRSVTLDMVTSSQVGTITASGGGTAGALASATTIQLQGLYGTEVFSFASGTNMATVASSIRSSTQLTGVSAITSGNALKMTSVEYGADGFVNISLLTGGQAFSSSSTASSGVNGTVLVNGVQSTVDGLEVNVRTNNLSADLTLSTAFATQAANDATFNITGGGAMFSIAPEISAWGQTAVGIQAVDTGTLGDAIGGYLTSLESGSTNDLSSQNFATAQKIITKAQEQVSSLRGRIGSFQKNTLTSAINSLLVAYENTSAAESAIRETDFAETTSALTRAQILVNSSTSTLQLANAAPQAVLSLLG